MLNNAEWTNNEASQTKLALSQLGYIDDSFVKYFCANPTKKTPEINRGYFARVHSITRFARLFCLREGATKVQIVNIGAGFDTLFFRLQSEFSGKISRFVDVDCNEVVERKIRAINKHEELLRYCGTVRNNSNTMFDSENYSVIAQDATKSLQLVEKLTKKCQIDKSTPVLFIFECVLLYWNRDDSTNVIHALSKFFQKCNFLIFDLVNTNDKFAHLMQQSLLEQNTPLLGADSADTLEDWNQKLTSSGLKHVKSWIMADVYKKLIDSKEKERIEKIEFLDEIELLYQLFNHYCLVIASNHQDVGW